MEDLPAGHQADWLIIFYQSRYRSSQTIAEIRAHCEGLGFEDQGSGGVDPIHKSLHSEYQPRSRVLHMHRILSQGFRGLSGLRTYDLR